jgi:hypothetical protein
LGPWYFLVCFVFMFVFGTFARGHVSHLLAVVVLVVGFVACLAAWLTAFIGAVTLMLDEWTTFKGLGDEVRRAFVADVLRWRRPEPDPPPWPPPMRNRL